MELEETLSLLQDTQKQLIESEKMAGLGQLVAGVAHEINTPLGVIITASSFIHDRLVSLKKLSSQRKMLKVEFDNHIRDSIESSRLILTNSKNAAELIKSFKQVSVDQAAEAKRSFNVKEYLDLVLWGLGNKFTKSPHKIIIECAEDNEIVSYPGAFGQIITNLLINTLDHAFEEDQEGKIIIKVGCHENTLTIKFSDNGRGIDIDHLGQIFMPFFTTARHRGGTGLGLYIVYNLVTQLFGGLIDCDSSSTRGTCFNISFPIS